MGVFRGGGGGGGGGRGGGAAARGEGGGGSLLYNFLHRCSSVFSREEFPHYHETLM